jgi:innexin
VRYIVNQMDRYMVAQRDFGTGCSQQIKQIASKFCLLVGGREYGNYLIVGYLAIKLVYFINAVGQIFLVASFVGPEYRLYGLHVIQRIYNRLDWTRLEHFPRVTLCEFAIRDQSRVHQYVVQCALSINLFNEKIFVFLWFWLVFVSILTAVDFFCWLFRAVYWPGQVHYIRRRLRAFDAVQRQPTVLARFAENYLRRDGMFVVRLIGLNIGDVAAGEVLVGLWNNYGPERRSIAERRRTATESKLYQNGHPTSPGARADMV